MRRFLDALKGFRAAFYRGPDWAELPEIAGLENSYRSPTVMLTVWIIGLLSRALSPTGIMLGGLTLVIAMYSTILPGNNAVALFFALFALYAVDFAGGWLFRPRLKIRRELPERVRAGSELELRYFLENKRSLPAWDLTLDPGLPSKALARVGDELALAQVPAKGSSFCATRVAAPRRGVFTIPKPLVESAFPFCVFKSSCRGGSAQTLIAHPAFKDLESLRMPGGPRLQKMGMAAVSKVGESMEFHGCREFRSGDDPRKIHWLGAARTGELVVKEFQEERLNRVALVLDTHCRRPAGVVTRLLDAKAGVKELESFEAAVSLTAAIAAHLAKDEFIIDLFATGTKTWRFRGGRSLAQLDDILDVLACVEPSYEEPFEDGAQPLLDELSAIGSVILVMVEADAKASELCRKISDSGAGLRALRVARDIGPEWTETISPDDIVAGRAARL